ncbi:hypothetical protein P9139_08125 [Curtobacterium flaccumfaciens]|nr:hypothetical protein P9139_08125 [Curtobacterium flaccumfaciens]
MRRSRATHERAVQPVETFPQLVTTVRTWMVPLRVPDELRSPILVAGICMVVVLGLLMASTFPDVSDDVSPIRVWGWMAPGVVVGAGLGLSWSALTSVGRKRVLDVFEALARTTMLLLLCLATGLAGVAGLLAASTGLADPPAWLDTSRNHALAWQIAAFAAVLTVGTFLMALGCRQTLVTSRLEARFFDTSALSLVVAAVTLAWGTALFIAVAPAGVPAVGVLLTGLSLVAGALGGTRTSRTANGRSHCVRSSPRSSDSRRRTREACGRRSRTPHSNSGDPSTCGERTKNGSSRRRCASS